jgi:hypothetical protein
MPYTQQWGISRSAFQSPLNDNGRRTIMEEPVETEEPSWAVPKVDISEAADKDIIEQNNEVSKVQTASLLSNIPMPVWKEGAKRAIKRGFGAVAGTAAGVLGMFLTPQTAHARPPGRMIDGEYVRDDDFNHPANKERYKNLDLSPPKD